jgi:serine protease AprX
MKISSLVKKRIDIQTAAFLSGKDENSKKLHPVVIRLKGNVNVETWKRECQFQKTDLYKCTMPQVGMMAGSICRETLYRMALHPDTDFISTDYKVKTLLNVARTTVGATAVKNQYGLTGKGVTIAIVDTGIYPHPDLINPTNRIVAFRDFINGRTDPYDDNGHGTHVAGDAASNGFSSSGLYAGPATEANLVGVKVLGADGGGSLSTVLQGIDFVIENRVALNIRIMNLSLGAIPFTNYVNDPLAQAVRRAWRAGIVVFAAAGNTGPNGTINTPGFDPLIITVGATQDKETVDRSDDEYAFYTSRGPTVNGFVKPDIAAPGSNITSLLAPNSTLVQQFPNNRVGNVYFTLSGTSMATPIAAGAAAQLLQAYPALRPDQVKALLKETSTFIADGVPGYLMIQLAVFLTTI